MYGYYAYDDGKGILAMRNSSGEEKTYSFDHKALSFDKRAYEIRQFYPISGESAEVESEGEYQIKLKPYEIKLYNIKCK